MNEKTMFSSWLCNQAFLLSSLAFKTPSSVIFFTWTTDPPSQQTGWWGTKLLIEMAQLKEKFCNLVKQYTLYLLFILTDLCFQEWWRGRVQNKASRWTQNGTQDSALEVIMMNWNVFVCLSQFLHFALHYKYSTYM